MCNCGKKRGQLTNYDYPPVVPDRPHYESNKTPFVRFEYIGKTALTTTGVVTGKRYRFNAPGEMLQVDNRDVSGLMSIPVLRKTLD